MSNIFNNPRYAGIINLGLLLSIIPIVFTFPHNIYAIIIAISLPCTHFAYIMFTGEDEIPNLREEKHD